MCWLKAESHAVFNRSNQRLIVYASHCLCVVKYLCSTTQRQQALFRSPRGNYLLCQAHVDNDQHFRGKLPMIAYTMLTRGSVNKLSVIVAPVGFVISVLTVILPLIVFDAGPPVYNNLCNHNIAFATDSAMLHSMSMSMDFCRTANSVRDPPVS